MKSQYERIHSVKFFKDPSEHAHRACLRGKRRSSLKRRRSGVNHTPSADDRFHRTFAATLRSAGLLEIVVKTLKLLGENVRLQKEIDQLAQVTITYSKTLQEELQTRRK